MRHHISHSHAISRFGFLSLLTLALYMSSASIGHAQLGFIICGVWELIYTDVGRGLATLAICALGVGAMLGKVSWGLAITVAVGIAVMFNADYLAGYLVGQSC